MENCTKKTYNISIGTDKIPSSWIKYLKRKGEGIMRKRLTAATLAALMALSMTACSGGKAAETTAAPETKVEETKAEESKACCGARRTPRYALWRGHRLHAAAPGRPCLRPQRHPLHRAAASALKRSFDFPNPRFFGDFLFLCKPSPYRWSDPKKLDNILK